MPPPPPPGNFSPPPGYVAYGAPGVVGRGVLRIGGLARAMRVLLIIIIPLQLVAAFNTFQIGKKAHDFVAGTISEAEFRDASTANIGSLAVIFVVPVAVLTMIWMYRMASNLKTIGRSDSTWGPGWAIAGWFVPPCAIYVIPWLMFKELWRGSDPEGMANDPMWKTRPTSPLVTVWWVLYGLVPIIGLVTASGALAQLRRPSADIVDFAKVYDRFSTLNLVVSFAGVVTTVVYLMLVQQLSQRHMKATHEA